MKYLFLSAFLMLSFLHLYASFADDAEKRKKTKPFLLILLLMFYLHTTHHPMLFLVLALLTSWIGDVLLIPKGHNYFVAGGISFLCSHLFFMLVYANHIVLDKVVWWIVIPVALLYFLVTYRIIVVLKPMMSRKMITAMSFYLIFNSIMNVFALMKLFSTQHLGSLIAFIGALLFYISDCTLFLVRYYPKPEIIYKKHFTIMLTYLLGEFLIVTGILLLRG